MLPGGSTQPRTLESAYARPPRTIRLRSILALAATAAGAFFAAGYAARLTADDPPAVTAVDRDVRLARESTPALRIVREVVNARIVPPLGQSPTPAALSADNDVGQRDAVSASKPSSAVPASDAAVIPSVSLPAPPLITRALDPPPSSSVYVPVYEAVRADPVAAPSTTALATADPRLLVRETLKRYAQAYDDLDASAAHTVWPTVNRDALAKAFAGLTAQNVSFNHCDVEVNGQTARADCTGTTRWTPRVGAGPQTQARQWSFRLKGDPAGWTIVSATVR